MSTLTANRPVQDRALDILRRAGNPFRNYFARNPDDEVCARYHVPELYATQRDQLLRVVDLYRYTPTTHSEVVPILGNKGAGKTHLLFSIKHGYEGSWQLLVTPGIYQRDTDFLEYLLFQMIDTLLGGGKQKNTRPLEYIGELVVRSLFSAALEGLTPAERLDLFPAPGLGKWARKLGLGTSQAMERIQWLMDSLNKPVSLPLQSGAIRKACEEAHLDPQTAAKLILQHIDRTEPRNTIGLMRRQIFEGFTRAIVLGEESDLATFLTYGFAELDFKVRPSRQELVLALFKAMMGVLKGLRIPVVIAFDQLEDLLLARRSDDAHRTAEAFFAGIVQAMHQLDGIAFLIFAERGLWNRFVPSLDGYIQDRLNNPIHLPDYGTLQALRLEAPPCELVKKVVEARLAPTLEQLADCGNLPPMFPFTESQIEQIAQTEPTLRDMLQQFRHLFDSLVYPNQAEVKSTDGFAAQVAPIADVIPEAAPSRLPPTVKSVIVVETPANDANVSPAGPSSPARSIKEIWDQECRAARRKLEPEGAMTGATRELQAGLGTFLRICHEHGVKVGPWRMQHVVPEFSFGEHPTYGVLSLAHWICRGGQPWKVGVGLFLGKGPAKPKDLGIKFSSLDLKPSVVDHLILLRPEEDLTLTGKSKSLWQEAERKGCHARLEPVALDAFALLYAFPRVIASIEEGLSEGQNLPNLADFIQENAEKLLQQVCMPIQG